jgi:hypothetical protein
MRLPQVCSTCVGPPGCPRSVARLGRMSVSIPSASRWVIHHLKKCYPPRMGATAGLPTLRAWRCRANSLGRGVTTRPIGADPRRTPYEALRKGWLGSRRGSCPSPSSTTCTLPNRWQVVDRERALRGSGSRADGLAGAPRPAAISRGATRNGRLSRLGLGRCSRGPTRRGTAARLVACFGDLP